jgi:starvation-inducible DNA-binding protein
MKSVYFAAFFLISKTIGGWHEGCLRDWTAVINEQEEFFVMSVMPSGLEEKVRQEIAEAINPVIAGGFALYEKTKTFYLNESRSRDGENRSFLDEQAQEIFSSMDELAEQVRQIGATPLRSISHTGELQSIESYKSDFLSRDEMIEELIAANQRIAASMRVAGKICEKICDTSIGVILQDVLDKTERRIKLLREAKMRK